MPWPSLQWWQVLLLGVALWTYLHRSQEADETDFGVQVREHLDGRGAALGQHWPQESYKEAGAPQRPLPEASGTALCDADRDALVKQLPSPLHALDDAMQQVLEAAPQLAEVRTIDELVVLLGRQSLKSAPLGFSETIGTLVEIDVTRAQWDVLLLQDYTSNWRVPDAARLELARVRAEELVARSLRGLTFFQSGVLPLLAEEDRVWQCFVALTDAYVRLGKREQLNKALVALNRALKHVLARVHIIARPGSPSALHAEALPAAGRVLAGERVGRAAAAAGDFSASVAQFRSALQGYVELDSLRRDDGEPARELHLDPLRNTKTTLTRLLLSLAHAAFSDPACAEGVALMYALAALQSIVAGQSNTRTLPTAVAVVESVLAVDPQSAVSAGRLAAELSTVRSSAFDSVLALTVTFARLKADSQADQGKQRYEQLRNRVSYTDAAAASQLIARLLQQRDGAGVEHAKQILHFASLAHTLAETSDQAREDGLLANTRRGRS